MRRCTDARVGVSTLKTLAARQAAVVAALLAATGCSQSGFRMPLTGELRDIERQAVRFLLTESDDPSPLHRMHAIEALQDGAPVSGRARIRAALRDPVPPVRFAALMASGTLRDRESIEAFRVAAEDNDRSVRVGGLFALHRVGDTRRTGEMASLLLRDPDPQVRGNTALAIGKLGEPKSIKLLTQGLKDTNELVRLQVMQSMVMLGDAKATRDLLFYGHSGVGPKMVEALMTLGTARASIAAELFEYRLKEGPYDEVRLAAARGLGRLGRDDGLPLASRMLAFKSDGSGPKADPPEQQEARIRTLAAAALEAIGDRGSLGALAGAMNDENQPMPVRIASARAILGILGHAQRDNGIVGG